MNISYKLEDVFEDYLDNTYANKLVKEAHEGKVVYHVSRDSTATEGREKAEKKARKEKRGEKRRRGRPKKGEERPGREESVLKKHNI